MGQHVLPVRHVFGRDALRREQATPPERRSGAEVLQAARESFWALMLPVIILVGLRMGVFTPTEAAVKVSPEDAVTVGIGFRIR